MEWAKEYRELMQREGKLVLPESFSVAKTIITIGGSDRLGLVDTGASKSHVSSNVYEELKAQGGNGEGMQFEINNSNRNSKA